MLNQLRKHMKLIKTFNLYLSVFVLGLSFSIIGPCLLDLQHLVHTDAKHIAMIFTGRSAGSILGGIIGGIVLDLTRFKLAVLMICNLFVTITLFGIPWSRNLSTLMIFICINGISLGAMDTGNNVLCLRLWGKDSNPVFQGLNFAFSVGGLLSPLIAAPFLENIKEQFLSNANNDNTTYLNEKLFNVSSHVYNYSININHFSKSIPNTFYPFTIVGAITLIVTLLLLAVCVIEPTEDECTKDDSKPPNSERTFMFMSITVVITFALFFVVAGTETGASQALTIYSVKSKLHLTATQGSFVTSALWAALTASRLISAFLAIKFSSLQLLTADICLIVTAAALLLLLMPNEWVLWLASVAFGAGIAPAYGAVIGWLNTNINISNKFAAIFTVGGASGDMVIPFVLTYFIDTNPDLFSYLPAASAILLTFLIFILYCLFKKFPSKTQKKEKCVPC